MIGGGGGILIPHVVFTVVSDLVQCFYTRQQSHRLHTSNLEYSILIALSEIRVTFPSCLSPFQCCSVPDSTSQILFSREEGFGDEDERIKVKLWGLCVPMKELINC